MICLRVLSHFDGKKHSPKRKQFITVHVREKVFSGKPIKKQKQRDKHEAEDQKPT